MVLKGKVFLTIVSVVLVVPKEQLSKCPQETLGGHKQSSIPQQWIQRQRMWHKEADLQNSSSLTHVLLHTHTHMLSLGQTNFVIAFFVLYLKAYS